jgi:hypothetical protein
MKKKPTIAAVFTSLLVIVMSSRLLFYFVPRRLASRFGEGNGNGCAKICISINYKRLNLMAGIFHTAAADLK